MKSKRYFLLLVLTTLILDLNISLAIVRFADDTIRKDIESILEKYELIRKQYDQLSSSDFVYIIRYGKVRGRADGAFETDGKNLYLTFKKTGKYSLETRFAHEATHAMQFEEGKIGFCQSKTGEWSPVNLDIWDEAEAFQMMIPVATCADLTGCMDREVSTNLRRFKRKLEALGIEKAAQWLSNIYPKLSIIPQHNPTVGPEKLNTVLRKRGFKFFYNPYQPPWVHTN